MTKEIIVSGDKVTFLMCGNEGFVSQKEKKEMKFKSLYHDYIEIDLTNCSRIMSSTLSFVFDLILIVEQFEEKKLNIILKESSLSCILSKAISNLENNKNIKVTIIK